MALLVAAGKAWELYRDQRGKKIIYTGEIEREAAGFDSAFEQTSKDRSSHVLVKIPRERRSQGRVLAVHDRDVSTPYP